MNPWQVMQRRLLALQKKTPMMPDVTDDTGTVLNLSDLSNSSIALTITVCIASGFILLALLATGLYVYKRRSGYFDSSGCNGGQSGHKVLLIKNQDITIDTKPYVVRKATKAVRSPSSTQVNPFNKKTPSPTGSLPSFSPSEEAKALVESAVEQMNTNSKVLKKSSNSIVGSKANSPPREEMTKILSSIENTTSTSSSTTNTVVTKAIVEPSVDAQANGECKSVEVSLGKLHFKLKYSYEKRALCLVILKCSDLVPTTKDGSLDPYVKMQLLPEKQHKAKTRVLRKTTNPVYNEEFTFYGVTPNLLESLVVHLVVLNFDRFARDEILGEVVCRLNQFEFDALDKQITLVRDIAPRGNKLKIQELGELLVSLCYQPIANRLTVVILKARNLPKMDLTGLCDPYVKIYVYHKGQRIAKKRTHIKKRTLSPVFNESFIFDIPPEEGLDNIQLQFMIYDHDRVTRNELIGKVDIGTATGVAISEKHWHEVIKSPRRQIAEWHKLKEVIP